MLLLHRKRVSTSHVKPEDTRQRRKLSLPRQVALVNTLLCLYLIFVISFLKNITFEKGAKNYFLKIQVSQTCKSSANDFHVWVRIRIKVVSGQVPPCFRTCDTFSPSLLFKNTRFPERSLVFLFS